MVPLLFLKKFYYIYVPFVSVDILIHKIIEVICCCYLVYLIPPKWKYSHIRASSLPIYLMTFGKIIACIFGFICYKDTIKNGNETKDSYNFNYYLLFAFTTSIYVAIGIVIYKSNNFRVKALARILRTKAAE